MGAVYQEMRRVRKKSHFSRIYHVVAKARLQLMQLAVFTGEKMPIREAFSKSDVALASTGERT